MMNKIIGRLIFLTFSFFSTLSAQDVYEIKVHEKELEQNNESNENKTDSFLKIEVDKNEAFIGEEIILTVKFYFDDRVRSCNLDLPELKDFYIRLPGLKKSGKEKINNEEFTFQEYKFSIFPKKIGELIFPELKAICIKQIYKNFFGFSIAQSMQSEVHSNSLKIKVKPLSKPVDAVGDFKSFKATLNQNEVEKGEGVILRFELEGTGELENIKFNNLNLPENLKYYESKQYFDLEKNKKTFEFIIQPHEMGKINIASQKFIFFNPKTNLFKTLETQPIELNVLSSKQKPKEDLIENQIVKEKKEENIQKKPEEIKPIAGPLFWILFLIPLLINIIIILKPTFQKNEFINNYKLNRSVFCKLNLCKKSNDNACLYKIFIFFFSQKYKINESLVTEDFIMHKLKESGFTKEKIEAWNSFFKYIRECAYFNTNEKNDIFIEAENWIKLFRDK